MPRFFVDGVSGDTAVVTGEDARHISKVLRMREGDELTLCDTHGMDYLCEIIGLGGTVSLRVLKRTPTKSEPTVKATVFQGLPKSDKMDVIVQKCVELGAFSIVPVLTERCVSRPNAKSLDAKTERWNKIALEAAKQSGRGIVPKVERAVDFEAAVGRLTRMECPVLLYERGGLPFAKAVSAAKNEAGLLIGPEGGFEESEAKAAADAGVIVAGLGPRILRTETAPLCALSALMFATGNL